MASQMQQGVPKASTDVLQKDLAAGRAVDVAGYILGPAVANGLGASSLVPPPGANRLLWLEVSTREPAQLLPAAEQVISAWRSAGCDVRSEVVSGPPFWQTLEIEDAPALVTATLSMIDPNPNPNAGLGP